MNLETITLQDCLDNYNFKGKCAIINDGKLIGFQEEIPTQTANPSGINSPKQCRLSLRLIICGCSGKVNRNRRKFGNG